MIKQFKKIGSLEVRSNRAIQNVVRHIVAQKKLPVKFKACAECLGLNVTRQFKSATGAAVGCA